MDLTTTEVAVSARHPIHDILAAYTGVEAGQLLVDLGCGHGTTLTAVAARTPGAVLVGIDIAADSLASAAHILGGAALMARADLSRPLPLPDATADVIVCHNVMELLVDPAALFTEIDRVLRVGGRAGGPVARRLRQPGRPRCRAGPYGTDPPRLRAPAAAVDGPHRPARRSPTPRASAASWPERRLVLRSRGGSRQLDRASPTTGRGDRRRGPGPGPPQAGRPDRAGCRPVASAVGSCRPHRWLRLRRDDPDHRSSPGSALSRPLVGCRSARTTLRTAAPMPDRPGGAHQGPAQPARRSAGGPGNSPHTLRHDHLLRG